MSNSLLPQPIPQLRQGPGGPLPPEHKRFNALLMKIEKAREALQTWQVQVPLSLALHSQVVQPLIDEYDLNERTWLDEMDALLAQPGYSNSDRNTLRGLVLDLAQELIETCADEDVPALKALYNRHSETGFDEDQKLDLEATRAMLEEAMGIDLSDLAATSEEELVDLARARWAEQGGAGQARARQTGAQTGAQPDAQPDFAQGRLFGEEPNDSTDAPRATKAKKLSKAQKQREADAQQMTQSVRDVYRKLASALHPDRAADDADRSTRTALMQRVNQAYERNDLLALLSLQLEIEQVDAAHLAQQTAARVRQFNHVLAEQLAELQAAVEEREMVFCHAINHLPEKALDPRRLSVAVGAVKGEINLALYTLERKRSALRDKASVKRWLKQERAEQNMERFGGFFF